MIVSNKITQSFFNAGDPASNPKLSLSFGNKSQHDPSGRKLHVITYNESRQRRNPQSGSAPLFYFSPST